VTIEGKSMKNLRGREMWENLKKGIKECETKRIIKIRKTSFGEYSWWDAEYKRKKKNV